MTVDAVARRFGLRWSEDADTTSLRRGPRVVRVRGRLSLGSVDDRHRALCVMLAVRYGLDLLGPDATRAGVKAVQRVVPRAAVELAEAIAERHIEARVLTSGSRLAVVAVAETGTSQLLMASSADAARELFFSAYKARAESLPALDARVTQWTEPGGLAPSLSSLLPDFDLDTARDGGFVFVPSWSQLVIVRGAPGDVALRAFGRQLLEQAALPMSRRVYRLTLDGLAAGEVVGVAGELHGAELVEHLLDVSS